MEENRIKVFDVTLREGEQTPGLSFTPREKVEITERMIEAGIRYMEVGLVGMADDEAAYCEMVKAGLTEKAEISMTLLPCAHLFDKAIDTNLRNINIVFPVTNYLTDTFGFKEEAFLKNNFPWVELLRITGKNIRLALADASRFVLLDAQGKITRDEKLIESNTEKLINLLKVFIERGVKGFIFTDTIGLLTPTEVTLCMNLLRNEIKDVEWGVHFHNDFGLATANTLAAYEQGATLLQASFNNLGERCGISAPGEIVAALKYVYGEELNIDLAQIRELAYTIEEITGLILNERQPVIGRGLYWYETATPILTMLEQDTNVFELIPAEDNGAERKIAIGKHTSNKLFKLCQERGIFEKETSLESLKREANEIREKRISELRSLIAEYHRAVKNSNLLFSIEEKSSLKIDDKIRSNDVHSEAEVTAG